jgi:hypothetical protein
MNNQILTIERLSYWKDCTACGIVRYTNGYRAYLDQVFIAGCSASHHCGTNDHDESNILKAILIQLGYTIKFTEELKA